MLESINNSCNETKLDQKNLDETFEVWWPKLDKKINEILTQENTNPKPTKRKDRDILEEILELARSNAKAIISNPRDVSRITVEALVSCYRNIKEKNALGMNIEFDLAHMANVIGRLCKECNFEDVYVRHPNIRSYNISGGMYRAKNSASESESFMPKRRKEESSDNACKQ